MKKRNKILSGFVFGVLMFGGSALTIQAEDAPYAIIEHGLLNVTYSKVLEYGEQYVLLEYTEAGFSSTTKEYGIYDIINQKWCMEYADYSDVSLEQVKYAGDGMFILTDANQDRYEIINGMYNMDMTRPLLFLDAKNGKSFYAELPEVSSLNFIENYSIGYGKAENWDIYEIGEDGSSYQTGIRDYCIALNEKAGRNADIYRCYRDANYVIYAFNDEYFIIYDCKQDKITDFYAPAYAERMKNFNTDLYVCGNYLVMTNLKGTDSKNYYAVLTMDGTEFIAPTICDDSEVTERGNILVRTGDQLWEVGLENKVPQGTQTARKLAKSYPAESQQMEYELGMDRKGTIYQNVVTYDDDMGRDTSNNVAGTWYLGGNYASFQGTWYFPYDTKDDGFALVQLVGDGRVIYESPVLNAQNCRADFSVDVSGIQQLRMEYSGEASLNHLLLGMTNDAFLPSGNISNVVTGPSGSMVQVETEKDEVLPVMLYDLYAYQGGFNKEEVVTDNMGNNYYKAIRVHADERKARYDIGGKYHTLSGIVAVTKGDQDTDTDRNKRGHIRIYGDDRLLWEDEDLNTLTHPYEMSVDISGVNDLRIEIQGFDARLMTSGINVIFENAMLQ